MDNATEYFTADELFSAYKKADLRRLRVSYQTALTTPLLRQSLEAHARAMRKEQQHSTPAPTLQAA